MSSQVPANRLANFGRVIRTAVKLGLALLALAAVWANSAQAVTLQQIGTFDEPIYVTSDPGNPERLFVVERGGSVVQLQEGQIKPFAKIGVGADGEGEEGGLLSIALSPDFDSSGRFFLDYTDGLGRIHVGEMVAAGGSAAASTLRDVISPISHPEDRNHYGGQLQFGPEGALFISTGDGGGSNDKHHNAQNPGSELGKILRLPNPGPFAAPEIWSLGLRNPFRFSFDRLTSDLWIGDVGQDAREEVDFAAAPGLGKGANYGWNCLEGSLPGPPSPERDPQCEENAGKFTPPVFEYPHENPGDGGAYGCAIIGGYIARGPGMGDDFGRYLYGDHCTDTIRSFAPSAPSLTDRSEHLSVPDLDSFGEDSCGRLYAASGNGPVYRLIGPEAATCPGATPPVPVYTPTQSPSYIAIRAVSRKVRRHRRGLITAWVTPCKDRRGDPVTLYRGRRKLGTHYLDRACSVRFRPRIDRRSSFRASTHATAEFLPAISRKVTIKPVRRRHH